MKFRISVFFCSLAFAKVVASQASPITVPAVKSWTAGAGTFVLPSKIQVVVDTQFQDAKDQGGLTLIPPTLKSFATTFALDLSALFPNVSVATSSSSSATPGSIFVTIDENLNATLASGAPTSEGYRLQVSTDRAVISGASPLGSWRGATTFLQGLVLGQGSHPVGLVIDQPDWATRGIMLDCGRQWYPANVLKEMCAYLAFFKASEFHLHLSDNLPGRVTGGLNSTYARFRLRTDKNEFAGLTPHLNETYSREEFDDLQQSCAARGVTIVPEIEAPGHALVITQWKPQLAIASDPTLLNLSIPESTQAMKDVWHEFLPWFHTKEVSIGADEYDSRLADDYIRFVGNMSAFIQQESNKTIRLWGTNEPSRTGLQLTRDAIVQHWEGSEDNAFQLTQQGYRVINSDDFFTYIVIKQSGSFPQRLNQTRLWHGNARGGPWDPTQFNRTVSTQANNPPPTSPLLRGGIMAAWNDQGPTASTPLEAFYSFKMGLPVIAAAAWRAGTQPGSLTQTQFNSVFETLERAAPGQNLDRRVRTRGENVVAYDFTANGSTVKDLSGNGYDARLGSGATVTSNGVALKPGATVDTPLGSKGANYTVLLSFSTVIPPTISTATLLSGPDTSFVLTTTAANTTFAFISSNITYALTGYVLPRGAGVTEVVLRGTEDSVSATVNGSAVGDFQTVIRNSSVRKGLGFVAPIAHIGGSGFEGTVKRLVVLDGLHNSVSIATIPL